MTSAQVLAGLTLSLVALTGCSEQAAQDAVDDARDRASNEGRSALEEADLPNVDWGSRSAELRNRLDKLAGNVDCAGLEKELAKVEGNDAQLTEYIKAQLRELDC